MSVSKIAAYLVFFASVGAFAQTDSNDKGGTLTVTWSPIVFNRQSCSSAEDITIDVVKKTSVSVPTNSELFIYWVHPTVDLTTSTPKPCTTNDTPDAPELFARRTLQATDTLVTGTSAFVLPDDLVNDPVLTTDELLDAAVGVASVSDPCAASGVQDTDLLLCVAVDVPLTGSTDNKISDTEPFGWVRFIIDTIAPPTPTISAVLPLDKGVDVEVSVPQVSGEVVSEAEVLYQEVGVSGVATDCTTWVSPQVASATVISGKATVGLDNLENGTTYEFCARSVDAADNRSGVSSVSNATPRDECDYWECYPKEVDSGYGCAALSPSWLFCAVLLFILRGRFSEVA